MSEARSPREVFLTLVDGVAARRDPAELAALYAEQTDVVHPFDPERGPALRTRDEIREHFALGQATRRAFDDRKPVDIVTHETADPEVIIAEFAYVGTNTNTGQTVRVPMIFVMRVRDGLIVESRDYADHLAGARAAEAANR
ncbi:MAG TPA: nuclear transport factor 2 family protein [Pseudonocardiaceae bacterium]|jgi:ketosteroid isomerase-like protein|nr:nuclear transport factor 2 family protein [Pseudonocardiaceae bacterium]